MEEHTINSMKKLYELEKFQIAYYMSQLSSTKDPFYHLAFNRMAQTGREHADFFAHILARADIPLPKVGGTLAELAGSILGESLELAGPENTCKVGIILTKKTLTAYHELIHGVKDNKKLSHKLLDLLLDQEFHALWLQDYAKRLNDKENFDQVLGVGPDEHPTLNVNVRWL